MLASCSMWRKTKLYNLFMTSALFLFDDVMNKYINEINCKVLEIGHQSIELK